MARPVYVPTVVERPLAVDRATAWAALVASLDVDALGDTCRRELAGAHVTETAISVESPWRLVLDATGGPSPFHQETVALVPDPPGCLAMWSALVLEPSDTTTEAYAEAVAAAVADRLDRVVQRLG